MGEKQCLPWQPPGVQPLLLPWQRPQRQGWLRKLNRTLHECCPNEGSLGWLGEQAMQVLQTFHHTVPVASHLAAQGCWKALLAAVQQACPSRFQALELPMQWPGHHPAHQQIVWPQNREIGPGLVVQVSGASHLLRKKGAVAVW